MGQKKRRLSMSLLPLFFIGLALLILSGCGAQVSFWGTEPIPTPTRTSTPTPTLSPTPTPIPTTLSSAPNPSTPSTSDPLQVASSFAAILGIGWTVFFGGKAFNETAVFQAIKSKTRGPLRWPKPTTITNILLSLIFVALILLLFHPTLVQPH